MVFMRVQSSELVANLFQECDPAKGDYHGLCKYVSGCTRPHMHVLVAYSLT